MVFVSCLHFWASGVYTTPTIDWVIVQKIYIFNHTNNIYIFCLLLIYSLMLCFWRCKALLYPYTTQFLNYTISFSISIWNVIFMMHCIYALVLGLHFCVKSFRFMPDFFFWHLNKIYLVLFTFTIHFIFFYIPSEQPNQAQFVCVYR